jgi:nucleotide-binding universal stress UspA family protein
MKLPAYFTPGGVFLSKSVHHESIHPMKLESGKSKRTKAPRPVKVLVPTDFSRNAEEALRFAVSLARQLGGKITLLHSIDWQVNPQMRSAPGVMDTMNKVAQEVAEDRLERLARTKVPQELLEKTLVKFAPAQMGIPETARELRIDLIVLSTRGHTGLQRILLGSTAARVVRYASCPVLTVRPVAAKVGASKAASLGPIIKRILVPVVFSEGCDSSIRFATTLARMMDAQLTLLHVVAPLPLNSSRYFAEVQQYDAEVKLDAKQRLESLAAALPRDIQSEVILRQNAPDLGIIRAARERRCDLITLPTRDLTGLRDFVLGSTAEKVIRHAPCPVLTFNRHSTATQKVTSKKPSRINIHSQQ